MINSNILIWNEQVGFVKINEGEGCNLFPEDEAQGYVDYIMMDLITYDGDEFIETDGAQVMLTEMYQEQFESETEVIQYLVDCGWIPDVEYVYLYVN